MSYLDSLRGIRILTKAIDEMEATRRQLEQSLSNCTARADDAELTATLYEQRADEFKAKATYADKLEPAVQKLLDAFDRLPLKMEDAGVVPSAAPPDIPLYGTYEWQSVMTAAREVQAINRKGEHE